MRWAALALGAVACLLGIIWMLQGVDFLGGSVMSGHPFWAWAGLAAFIAGLGLLYTGIRKGTSR